MSNYRPINPITARAVKSMGSIENHKYYKNILIPSAANQHSIAIEFMRDWFLEKFPKNYFKTVHIEGRHVAQDYFNKDAVQRVKALKPMLAIIPKINLEYNRDTVDLNQTNLRLRTDPFFRDIPRNMAIKAYPDQIEMPFDFRVRVSTRAAQVDLYNRMKLLFPVLASETHYIDIDMHIPYELVIAVGRDAGFEVDDNGVLKDSASFVAYMNTHSSYIFLEKFRGLTHRNEIFMKWPEACAHIKIDSALSPDDGEREGALYNNFNIEMSLILRFPSIQYYEYLTTFKHDYIINEKDESEYLGMFAIPLLKIPELNNKGWMQYSVHNYEDDDAVDNYLEIDFSELFAATDIGAVTDYTKSIFINPAAFMDIHLYNSDTEIQYDMNWNTLTLKTLTKVKARNTYIVIYADHKYINDAVSILRNVKASRYRINMDN